MNSFSTFPVFYLCFVLSVQATTLPYLCQLYGCGADPTNSCDFDTGMCTCATPNSNYACTQVGVPGSCDVTNNCATSRIAPGPNYCVDGANNLCMCLPGFSGGNCNTERIVINCDNTAADEISVSLTPYSYSDGEQFNGNIYIASSFDGLDFSTIPAECQMIDGDSSLPLTPVHITGGGGCEQLTVSGGEYYTFAYIQHNPLLRSEVDHLIRLSCFSGSNPSTPGNFDVSVNDATASSMTPLESTVTTGAATDITMSLEHQTSSTTWDPLTPATPISLGHDLSLILTHPTDKFMVKSCTAQNYAFGTESQNAPNVKTLKIIDNWCITREALAMIRTPGVVHAVGDGTNGAVASLQMFRLDFDAFYFPGPSSQMHINCFVCTSNCATTTPPACSNTFTGYAAQNTWMTTRRRRRDAVVTANNSTTENIAVSVTVGQPGSQVAVSVSTDNGVDVGECYKSISVILPLILLAVLLVVAMVMTFFFCVKLTSGSHGNKGETNMAYKS